MTDFGLAIRNFVGPGEVPDIHGLYAYAERAEALGFESLWAWDHVLLGVEPSFPIVDSITMLGAIAARTRTIRLGTGVLVLPLRNPVVAAKALGSLDVISGGRLILGVAAGWYAREFDAVGVPFKQRGRQFERNLDILMRLWTEDRVTLKVDEFNLREAVMVPRTVQRPRPPILIGGYVDAVLKRAGTVGDGWLTYFYTPESFTQGLGEGEGLRARGGARPRRAHLHEPARDLRGRVARSRPPPTCGTGCPPSGTPRPGASPPSSTPSTAAPAECVEQLRAHVATGVNRIILIPYRYQPEQVERIAKEVLPRL